MVDNNTNINKTSLTNRPSSADRAVLKSEDFK